MTHISFGASTASYNKLYQEALVYKGECSICATYKQDLYSMHQIENELYDVSVHGPIIKANGLSGVFKSIEIIATIKKVTTTLSKSVFHQVAKGSDDNLHIFSPAHNACLPCIGKIKKLASAYCPLCRFKLPIKHEPASSSSSRSDVRRTSTTAVSETKSYIDPGFGGPYIQLDDKDRSFKSLSRGQKKTMMHAVAKKYNQISPSVFLEDIMADREEYADEEISAYNPVHEGSGYARGGAGADLSN